MLCLFFLSSCAEESATKTSADSIAGAGGSDMGVDLGIPELGSVMNKSRQSDELTQFLNVLLGPDATNASGDPAVFSPNVLSESQKEVTRSSPFSLPNGSQTFSVARSRRLEAFRSAGRQAAQQENVQSKCQSSAVQSQSGFMECVQSLSLVFERGGEAAKAAASDVQGDFANMSNSQCAQFKFFEHESAQPVTFNPEPAPDYMELAIHIVQNGSERRPPVLPGETATSHVKYPPANQSYTPDPEAPVGQGVGGLFVATERSQGVFDVTSGSNSSLFLSSWGGTASIRVDQDMIPRVYVLQHLRNGRPTVKVPLGVADYPFNFMKNIDPRNVDTARLTEQYVATLPKGVIAIPYMKFVPTYPHYCYGYFSDQQGRRTPSGMVFLLKPPSSSRY